MKTHQDQEARKNMLKNCQETWNMDYTTSVEFIGCDEPILDFSEVQLELRVKKLNPDAIMPTRAHKTDAGYDLYALEGTIIDKHSHKLVKTGISIEIPEGFAGFIWPRSGLAYKYGLDVFAGVIDAGYRGDVGVILYNSQYSDYHIEAGDRIAQIVFQKVENFKLTEVDSLNDAHRGDGGFGSTGS